VILHYPDTIDTRDLNPGTIVFMICDDGSEHKGEMILRKAGLEVRDSIRWFHGSPVKHLTVVVGRKPIEGTVVQNVLRYGCGGINVDACRVPHEEGGDSSTNLMIRRSRGCSMVGGAGFWNGVKEPNIMGSALGRWPANVIHDGECGDLFPFTVSGKGIKNSSGSHLYGGVSFNTSATIGDGAYFEGDSGSAARFFYVAETETALIEYLERLVKS
jgi:site-specific DNA-methyltransferase (adenine-specific)